MERMPRMPRPTILAACWLAAGLLAACSGGGTPDTTAPAVVAVTPAASAAAVGVGSAIEVTFSEPVQPGSVTAATFTVESGGTAISGTRSVQGAVARFVPLGGLSLGSSYRVTLTTGIRDLAGNPLARSHVWEFTTAALATVDVRWTPSRASGVNATGGGYRVYWSTTPGFTIGPGTNVINVPWPGSGQTPASVSLDLAAGNYYFKVVAYADTDGGIESTPSAEISVSIR